MKKKEALDDLDLYIDPKPMTKEEEIALSLFIRKLKEQRIIKGKGAVGRKSKLLRVNKVGASRK